MKYLIGAFYGWLACAVCLSVLWSEPWDQRASDEMQRDYDAYRECIPKPNCMTSTAYLDYYDLKWKLEKELTDMK